MKELELDDKVIISLLNFKAKTNPIDTNTSSSSSKLPKLPKQDEQKDAEEEKETEEQTENKDNEDTDKESKEEKRKEIIAETPKITESNKSKSKMNVNCVAYWAYNFVHASISDSIYAVKRLIEYIGTELFVKKLLDRSI